MSLTETRMAGLTGNDQWFTPSEYVEMAREVLGGIDLDPSSSSVANETVRADRYFTVEQDGLSQDWTARTIFLNPDYGRVCRLFVEKLCAGYTSGDFVAAILLVNNSTETRWAQQALATATAVAFPASRIKFVPGGGQAASMPAHGQMFFYFGPDPEKFKSIFSEIGTIVLL